jgi:hypothetical protein
MDIEALKKRIDALINLATQAHAEVSLPKHNELYNGAITVLSAVYGTDSHQVSALRDFHKIVTTKKEGRLQYNMRELTYAAEGALQNLKGEIEGGVTGSLLKRLTSEVLTDMVQLARAVMDEPADNAKNVAAVLAAASFEDTIRRMGSAFAGVMGKDDLSNVIDALKSNGILVAPQLGIAIGYLNFRNRALHANWDQIDRAAVNSVLGFVEGLLLKHFQ